jgi:hypothetical protein
MVLVWVLVFNMSAECSMLFEIIGDMMMIMTNQTTLMSSATPSFAFGLSSVGTHIHVSAGRVLIRFRSVSEKKNQNR